MTRFYVKTQGVSVTLDASYFPRVRESSIERQTRFRVWNRDNRTVPLSAEEGTVYWQCVSRNSERTWIVLSESDCDILVDSVLKQMRIALDKMQSQKIGALIVLETSKSRYLERLAKDSSKAEALECNVTAQLLLAIFDKTVPSPLHDGATVIRLYGSDIGSHAVVRWAGLIANLEKDKKVHGTDSTDVGTRHRAALQIHLKTGFPVVIVSGERGEISVAHRGTRITCDNADR